MVKGMGETVTMVRGNCDHGEGNGGNWSVAGAVVASSNDVIGKRAAEGCPVTMVLLQVRSSLDQSPQPFSFHSGMI